MNANPDRLYELLPLVYRMRDADRGYPLRALLQVIAEQIEVVEQDIEQLYENWFIETCESWVVSYIADLIGCHVLADTAPGGPNGAARSRRLIPRREVANTIRSRRRKGTIAVLEELARGAAGWPARTVEFYRLLGVAQSLNHRHLRRGRTIDVRDGDALDRLGSPFDELAHVVDVRRAASKHRTGLYDIPSVGVFVWRLQSYSVTRALAYCLDKKGGTRFVFSILGNDTALFTPQGPSDLRHPTGELDFPVGIRRRAFERNLTEYYGEGKSLQIFAGPDRAPLPPERLIAADLTDWTYEPPAGRVAVDPMLGRMVFASDEVSKQDVWVSYRYGFSADIGGGEYDRPLSQPSAYTLYLVGGGEKFTKINDALARWKSDQPQHAVIEITDGGVYVEPIAISLQKNQTLQIRAAKRTRPVLQLMNWHISGPDDVAISGDSGSWFIVDGLLIAGRGIRIEGNVAGVAIRHSTLVPGWGLNCDCEPDSTEPSITLIDTPQCLTIEHSIVGPIYVTRHELQDEAIVIHISDSIVDATTFEERALCSPKAVCAEALLTLKRSTVLGQIQVRSIELAENSIVTGTILTCRRQTGCMRFCYVRPGSRTPARYHCQPDLVEQAVNALFDKKVLKTVEERDSLRASEQLRVEPDFNSVRYGRPTYCQLATDCAEEIKRGADDESEMGVFHDLYQPQREANLRAQLDEYTPAGMDAAIVFAS